MSVPVLLIKEVVKFAVKKKAKAKIIKDAADFLLYQDVDKMDKVLSYIGGTGGKALRFFKKYKKKTNQMLDKIAKNEKILQRLKNGEKLGNKKKGGDARWSENKALKNIERARYNRNKWVRDSIKKEVKRKVLNKLPGKRLFVSIDNLAKAIHSGKNWKQICKKAGSVLYNMGDRDISHLINTIDYFGSMTLTTNQLWKKVSENHSANFPIIGSSGGMKLRYLLRLKDKYQEQIFDRTFYFYVYSYQTGNFDQQIHYYDPVLLIYGCPIRGWAGTRVQYYNFYNKIKLSNVLSLTISSSTDFGSAIYHRYLFDEYYTAQMVWWINKDPHYKKEK